MLFRHRRFDNCRRNLRLVALVFFGFLKAFPAQALGDGLQSFERFIEDYFTLLRLPLQEVQKLQDWRRVPPSIKQVST